ncbi:MAG: thiamine diphosphokinase [Candidatus Diapherotrites archaeon]|nr:thiamine diphosphokinase [Candidatus Diapherotrites archaeon]
MFIKKKRAVLLCAGVLAKTDLSLIQSSDFLIAVDGGANHLVKTKLVPNLIIGDMDSISKKALKKFKNVSQLKFPIEKDFLDIELAINFCKKEKFKEIIILGAWGNRADMVLTHVFLLVQIPKIIQAKLVFGNQEVFLASKKQVISGVPGMFVSFIPLSEMVQGFSLKGFKYPAQNTTLHWGKGKTLSNTLIQSKGVVSFKKGVLACVYFKKNSSFF